MKHKHKYTDSSFESDSCDYSYDDAENEAAKHRQHVKKQQTKDKSKSSNETEAKNSKKEDEDDGSVSDDSLEVIVVKRSLEKKCEKVVSGRSKTPRECTKETKLMKTHKRSSKKMSRPSKSRPFDKDENIVDQDKSPGREERRAGIIVEELAYTSAEEEEGGSEKIIESRFRKDATDSTSQETVERVVVTAIVHKDQIPDTPRSTQETAKEMSSDNVLRKKTIVIEETFKSINSSDKSKTALSHKTDTHEISKERSQRVTQENLQMNEEVENKDEKNKIMSSNIEDAKEGTSSKTQPNFNVIIFS